MRRFGPVLALLLASGLAASPVARGADDPAAADEKLLKEGGVANDGPALLKYFETRQISDSERQKVLALIQKLGDDSFQAREDATETLEGYGPAVVGLLKQGLRDADLEVSRRCQRALRKVEKVPASALTAAAARQLGRLKPARTAEVLLAWLPLADDESVAEEARSALAAVAVRDGKPDESLVKALADESPVRRGAGAEALARGRAADALPGVRKLLKDADPDVRFRAALALASYAKDRPSVGTLVELLTELPPASAWRAEEALGRLAGDDAPKVSLGGTKESRQRCREQWQAWWEKAGDKVDLARLTDGPRFLGYTLLMELNLRGVNGRIVELGPDSKPRWKLDGLMMPLDAQVLPGDKVLVAEHNANKVTERDLTGKVLWEKAINLPVACKRLPDGNTFIAGRGQLVELSADNKEVFTLNRPGQDIVAAARTRTGEYVFMTNTGTCVRVNSTGKELKSFAAGQANYYSGLEILPNGNILLTQINGVAEFDPENGKQVWKADIQSPTSVQRLPNGNTLTTSINTQKVVELDRDGKSVWEYADTEGFRPWRARRR